MEKDTVLLSVEIYNELRDFKKEITNGNTMYVYGWNNTGEFISTEEAVKIIVDANDNLRKEIKVLRKDKGRQQMIDEIKSMNWWRFRRWKQRPQ